jgi:hypothetical protein
MSTNNPLPDMATVIQDLIRDDQISVNETDDADCSICIGPLVSNEHGVVVRMPPCNHLFHKHCILGLLNSTSPTRYLCPNCRAPLRLFNVLSPAQEASRQADEAERNNVMDDFNMAAYTQLMTLADNAFNVQWNQFRPQGREDYTRIGRDLNVSWDREAANGYYVCYEHIVMGSEWLEYVVAQRVAARLRQYPGAVDTTHARSFLRYSDWEEVSLDLEGVELDVQWEQVEVEEDEES